MSFLKSRIIFTASLVALFAGYTQVWLGMHNGGNGGF